MVVGLHQLTEKALVKIMTEPKNAIIKQYKKMFKIDNVDLIFEPEAINAVAKKALELKTGARGLRTILEDAMLDLMYNTPSDTEIEKIIINKGYITEKKEPVIQRRTKDEEARENII
ncbi:MAG: hypothetical protein PHX09_00600 [Clostridia bacterium]|nr:hypothetical protein [Clostridia bacterium]